MENCTCQLFHRLVDGVEYIGELMFSRFDIWVGSLISLRKARVEFKFRASLLH